jgi:hypothetical protein
LWGEVRDAVGEHADLGAEELRHEVLEDGEILGSEPELLREPGGAELAPKIDDPRVTRGDRALSARGAIEHDEAAFRELFEIDLGDAAGLGEGVRVDRGLVREKGRRAREVPLHLGEQPLLRGAERLVRLVEHGLDDLEWQEALVLELANELDALHVRLVVEGHVAAGLLALGQEPLLDVEVNDLAWHARARDEVFHLEGDVVRLRRALLLGARGLDGALALGLRLGPLAEGHGSTSSSHGPSARSTQAST